MKKINEKKVFSGKVFNVVEKTISDGNNTIIREIVQCPAVVHIFPIDIKTGKVYLTTEYRSGVEQETIGFPAGKIDDGETPEDCAERETNEEIKKDVKTLIRLSNSLYSSEGICDEKCYFFIAMVDDFKYNQYISDSDIDENITYELLSLDDVIKKVGSEFNKNNSNLGIKTYLMTILAKNYIDNYMKKQ